MKKVYIVALLASISLFIAWMAPANTDTLMAKQKVSDMFGQLQKLSTRPADKGLIRDDLLSNYLLEYQGQIVPTAPNEFKHIGYNALGDGYFDPPATTYINTFISMFEHPDFMNVRFEYEVNPRVDLYRKPDYKDEVASIAEFNVTKRYIRGNSTIRTFNDMVRVDLMSNRVIIWRNEVSHNPFDDEFQDLVVSIERLKSDAAIAYTKKDYREAYNIYNKILSKDKNDGETNYCMAVLVYRHFKKIGLSKKEREKKVLDCLNTAISNGNWSIRNKADNMLYWITC